MSSGPSVSATVTLGVPDPHDGLPEIPGLEKALQEANEASALTDEELSNLLRTATLTT